MESVNMALPSFHPPFDAFLWVVRAKVAFSDTGILAIGD